MTPETIAAALCSRLAHRYGPAADTATAGEIQRELEAAIRVAQTAKPDMMVYDGDKIVPMTLAGMSESKIIELREAAHDYASLIQVENFDRNDIAVHRAYERLRKALEIV